MAQVRYPSLADVIAIHEHITRKLGEVPEPLRDEGLLESAVMRPQMAAWYESADLIRQGALLAIGISQAQAFVDGNKRTAFATLDAFLLVNGWEIIGDPLALAKQLERFAEQSSQSSALDEFEAWLRAHVQARGATDAG